MFQSKKVSKPRNGNVPANSKSKWSKIVQQRQRLCAGLPVRSRRFPWSKKVSHGDIALLLWGEFVLCDLLSDEMFASPNFLFPCATQQHNESWENTTGWQSVLYRF
jgi:hypothetical protein